MQSPIKVCGVDIRVSGRLIRTARLEREKYEALADPETLVAGLRKCGVRVDLFTFVQRLPEIEPRYRYHVELDNRAVLSVSTFENWWTKQINNKTRNLVRKAEKSGVEVRQVPLDDALVRGIWEIYNEAPVRGGRRFPHYGKDIETVRREEATLPERTLFLGAYVGAELVGFVRLVEDDSRTQANLINILSMLRHRDKSPTNALIAEAVRTCSSRGIKYLLYESFEYGNKGSDGLSQFKAFNGFQRVDLPRYFLPLTSIGSLALRFDLHRRWSDHVPAPVADRMRKARTAWLNRKFRSAPETSST